MSEKSEQGNNWENIIKALLNRLDIPTKQDILHLHTRLDKLEQLLYQKRPAAKTDRSSFSGGRKSAASIVLEVIGNHPEGTNFKTVKAATGFNDKKLRNIIFRLDKLNRIERVTRGVYKAV